MYYYMFRLLLGRNLSGIHRPATSGCTLCSPLALHVSGLSCTRFLRRIISMIIAAGTVISSLQNDRLTKKLGTGKITAISVATTAVALIGFSVSHSFIALCLWAVPYGLGGGSVDAALNNYVALHYESRHMSWLHLYVGYRCLYWTLYYGICFI